VSAEILTPITFASGQEERVHVVPVIQTSRRIWFYEWLQGGRETCNWL